MESILLWTLVTAAIAIILMLGLLIASERELKRARAELGRLRSAFESAEVAALTKQLQTNQAAMTGMQDDLEALRAENSWLRQQTEGQQSQRPEPEAQTLASSAQPEVVNLIVRGADNRRGQRRRKSQLLYSAAAIVFLLVTAVIYFKDVWRSKAFDAAGLLPLGVEQPGDGNDKPEGAKAAPAAAHKPSVTMASRPAAASAKSGGRSGTNYQVVRSTRVFSQPNDGSRALARVEAGMEINVVDVRDDWLEVRSRHGRPSGFIKSDAAVIKELK